MSDLGGDRSSISSLWKRGKQKLKGKEEASPGSQASPTNKDGQQTAKDKAQLRRAQVRRAQIEHRQRKANYVKQLELDVTQLRDMISLAEREAGVLRRENEDIIVRLRGAGIGSPAWQVPGTIEQQSDHASQFGGGGSFGSPQAWSSPGSAQQQLQQQLQPADDMQVDELFGDIDIDDLTVTLSVNKTMGTPCFHISSSSSGASISSSASPPQLQNGDSELTPEQETTAINFILSLEHVCWDHFGMGDFHGHDDCQDESDEIEKGHTLMASAYCMANAPDSVYSDRKAFKNRLRPSPTLKWGSTGITLDALHGLAASLNPGDLEVAPVQAWFEMASRYPSSYLFRAGILETLQKEFKGVVRCVYFGAAMEREAFESIVTRVLGPTNVTITPI